MASLEIQTKISRTAFRRRQARKKARAKKAKAKKEAKAEQKQVPQPSQPPRAPLIVPIFAQPDERTPEEIEEDILAERSDTLNLHVTRPQNRRRVDRLEKQMAYFQKEVVGKHGEGVVQEWGYVMGRNHLKRKEWEWRCDYIGDGVPVYWLVEKVLRIRYAKWWLNTGAFIQGFHPNLSWEKLEDELERQIEECSPLIAWEEKWQQNFQRSAFRHDAKLGEQDDSFTSADRAILSPNDTKD